MPPALPGVQLDGGGQAEGEELPDLCRSRGRGPSGRGVPGGARWRREDGFGAVAPAGGNSQQITGISTCWSPRALSPRREAPCPRLLPARRLRAGAECELRTGSSRREGPQRGLASPCRCRRPAGEGRCAEPPRPAAAVTPLASSLDSGRLGALPTPALGLRRASLESRASVEGSRVSWREQRPAPCCIPALPPEAGAQVPVAADRAGEVSRVTAVDFIFPKVLFQAGGG